MLMGSCSITKRRYTNGWHVEWHKKHRSTGEESSAAHYNDAIRLTEIQANDSMVESTSVESTTIAETETIPLEEETPAASSTEDTPLLSETLSGTAHSIQNNASENTVSEDEPEPKKQGVFPNSERVIPIPLAIILTILLLTLGIYLSSLVGALFYLALAFSLSGYSVLAGVIAIFFGALVFGLTLFLIFLLYNRKKTKYASTKERNMMYAVYAFGIAGGIALLVWLAVSRTAW